MTKEDQFYSQFKAESVSNLLFLVSDLIARRAGEQLSNDKPVELLDKTYELVNNLAKAVQVYDQ